MPVSRTNGEITKGVKRITHIHIKYVAKWLVRVHMMKDISTTLKAE